MSINNQGILEPLCACIGLDFSSDLDGKILHAVRSLGDRNQKSRPKANPIHCCFVQTLGYGSTHGGSAFDNIVVILECRYIALDLPSRWKVEVVVRDRMHY